MPKCTINGKEIEVKAGTTIIEAYKSLGEEIAHYCWHPGLSVAGVCRMCVCEIKGNPKPQIACNTMVNDGMVISNQSDAVKDAVKWVLEFHLLNHPLDCPICDQAGECGLQEYYMKHGAYIPQMGEKKVKKRKVVNLGERVVLDTERCILCSRCVRFTDEITKTNELGIFNRGDRAEIGTHADKPLNNNYSLNTVDICPVGALTSKDFRFQQRVWLLKDFETTCPGCSTGCSTKVYYNENGLYRVKPVFDKDVNGYWMCDEGRDVYKYINVENRLTQAIQRTDKPESNVMAPGKAAQLIGARLKEAAQKSGADSVALVLTGQYTNEEFRDLSNYFIKTLGSKQIFHWFSKGQNEKDFDGLLLRGDKNPNTQGLRNVMKELGIQTNWSGLEADVKAGKIKAVVVAGPENQSHYSDLSETIQMLSGTELIWLTACPHPDLASAAWQVPTKTYVEKSGTFVNFNGTERLVRKGTTVVSQALTLTDFSFLLSGLPIPVKADQTTFGVPTTFAVGAL